MPSGTKMSTVAPESLRGAWADPGGCHTYVPGP